MVEIILLSIALLGFAIIIFSWRKWQRSKEPAARVIASVGLRTKTYPAVGIRYNLLACNAVQKFYGRRYLAQDAPALPVVNCNVRPCPCRYMHFADRRATDDRRAEYGIRKNFLTGAGSERRQVDRRQTPALA